jgi:xanthine dehydrogenase small subunit
VERKMVRFILNGEHVENPESWEMTLLRYLREKRGLTGTKNGCSTRHCGACAVLIDERTV